MNPIHAPIQTPTPSRDPERTREALMTSGTELFAEYGYEGATIELIARRAGVNKALINYHFRGKKGLYTAILASTLDSVATRLAETSSRGESAETRLAEFIQTFAEMNLIRPAISVVLLREAITGGRHLDDAIIPSFLAIFRHVNNIVAQGVREGTFRPVDPLLTHLTVIGSLVFFFATSPMRQRVIDSGKASIRPPDPADFVAHLKELMTRGLSSAPRSRS